MTQPDDRVVDYARPMPRPHQNRCGRIACIRAAIASVILVVFELPIMTVMPRSQVDLVFFSTLILVFSGAALFYGVQGLTKDRVPALAIAALIWTATNLLLAAPAMSEGFHSLYIGFRFNHGVMFQANR